MILNKASLSAFFQGLHVDWSLGAKSVVPEWSDYAMLRKSTTTKEIYRWFQRFPIMRLWIGEKMIKALAAYKYELENKPYEATIEVDRDDIEDDIYGDYADASKAAGISAMEWPDILVADVIKAAFTALCFDGQFFFDTDHPQIDSTGTTVTYSNKITAVLSATTAASASASIGAAITKMETFADTEGQPLNLAAGTLVVGSALRETAFKLANQDELDDQSKNPNKGMFKVKVNKRLGWTTQWMLMADHSYFKPFVFQERKKAHFVQMIGTETEEVFKRAKYLYGNEGRGAAGYTFPQLAVGSTGAG
ncbi:MAG: Mu-like prophage major head subunit gpT family protein [Deltaproteobacteria bacterium]|nr:Mu-like prophage major head subunit gpT family protein [Deltaproteobacteria bacterium]